METRKCNWVLRPRMEDIMNDAITEYVDFGISTDPIPLLQLNGATFHSKCLQANSDQEDSTGLRLHGGTHVGVRYLHKYISKIDILFNKDTSICELGCGTGAFGLLGFSNRSSIRQITMTDGNIEAIHLSNLNWNKWLSMGIIRNEGLQVMFAKLVWEREHYHSFLRDINNWKRYDIALGCELMYYRTDMASLVDTVQSILKPTGLFIHVHVIRAVEQGQHIREALGRIGWDTIEVPKHLFISKSDRLAHPEWYYTRCLISGSADILSELRQRCADSHLWLSFKDDIDDSSSDEDYTS